MTHIHKHNTIDKMITYTVFTNTKLLIRGLHIHKHKTIDKKMIHIHKQNTIDKKMHQHNKGTEIYFIGLFRHSTDRLSNDRTQPQGMRSGISRNL